MKRRSLQGLSPAEHQRAGRKLKQIQSDLKSLFSQISACYPKASSVVRNAGAASDKVQRLRLGLRDAMEKEQKDSKIPDCINFPPDSEKAE